MKSKLSLGVISGVCAVLLMATPAFAWHFNLSGKGNCQADGSYKIIWTVDNRQWNKPLVITASNNSAVPVGTTIPKRTLATFTQAASGLKAAKYNLSLTGRWGNEKWSAKADTDLCKACDQPQTPPSNPGTPDTPTIPDTPPAGGMGGGVTDTPVAVPTATTTASQVIVPAGAVNAGKGGVPKSLSIASIAGLLGSVTALGFGLHGLKKRA